MDLNNFGSLKPCHVSRWHISLYMENEEKKNKEKNLPNMFKIKFAIII